MRLSVVIRWVHLVLQTSVVDSLIVVVQQHLVVLLALLVHDLLARGKRLVEHGLHDAAGLGDFGLHAVHDFLNNARNNEEGGDSQHFHVIEQIVRVAAPAAQAGAEEHAHALQHAHVDVRQRQIRNADFLSRFHALPQAINRVILRQKAAERHSVRGPDHVSAGQNHTLRAPGGSRGVVQRHHLVGLSERENALIN